MDFENEKKDEQQFTENAASREGYQKEYRPVGRSPRPRIHTGQRPVNSNFERPSFNKHSQDDEGGFRPEGFGAGLQSQAPQRSYRPRTNNYNNNGGGYQSRQQGGYQQRPQQGGYRPRYNQEGDDQQGYQSRQGGYQQRGGYGQRPQQGGYQQRGNAIAPGFIETAMTAALPEDIRKEWCNKIPLRRGGQVEDIANVATFLASDMSSYVSGQVIQVDGGMNM